MHYDLVRLMEIHLIDRPIKTDFEDSFLSY